MIMRNTNKERKKERERRMGGAKKDEFLLFIHCCVYCNASTLKKVAATIESVMQTSAYSDLLLKSSDT